MDKVVFILGVGGIGYLLGGDTGVAIAFIVLMVLMFVFD